MTRPLRELLFLSRAALASIAATGIELVLVKALTGRVRPWILFASVQVIANAVTFFAYKYWAFGARGDVRTQYGRQIPVFAGSWLLNIAIPSLFHYKLGLRPWLAFASANVFTYLGWNYPLNRYWVFRGAVETEPAPEP